MKPTYILQHYANAIIVAFERKEAIHSLALKGNELEIVLSYAGFCAS